MAISGSWLQVNGTAPPWNWGTGVNPIHSIQTMGPPLKSSEVNTGYPPGSEPAPLPPEVIDWKGAEDAEGQWPDQEFSSSIWGYGIATGTATRPGFDVSPEESASRNSSTPGYPDWGSDVTDDSEIFRDRGVPLDSHAKLGDKEETVSEGWVNKAVGGVIDSEQSDVSQIYMNTSQVQRDKVRTGSQNPNTGTASEHDAPIGSYRPTRAVRIKPWSGGFRHWDMIPRFQDQIVRPFLNRQAATGAPEWMHANEAIQYMRPPLQRQPVPDPYAGVPIIGRGNVYEEESYPTADWVNVWY